VLLDVRVRKPARRKGSFRILQLPEFPDQGTKGHSFKRETSLNGLLPTGTGTGNFLLRRKYLDVKITT
jgi:hypothetical protein